MKLWIDDVRPAPEPDWIWLKSVDATKWFINQNDSYYKYKIELIDIDHDAGDFYYDGGDFIRVLDWLEETGRNYPIHIHSMNPVGVANMRAIIERNGWKEIR